MNQSCKDGHLSTNQAASMTGKVRDEHINTKVSNPFVTEEFDQASSRLDNKLKSLQNRIEQLSVQFDLEKDGEEFCE